LREHFEFEILSQARGKKISISIHLASYPSSFACFNEEGEDEPLSTQHPIPSSHRRSSAIYRYPNITISSNYR
jgi:hypothetical protein